MANAIINFHFDYWHTSLTCAWDSLFSPAAKPQIKETDIKLLPNNSFSGIPISFTALLAFLPQLLSPFQLTPPTLLSFPALSSCFRVLHLSLRPSFSPLVPSSPSCSVPSCSLLITSSPLPLSFFLLAHFLSRSPHSASNDFYPISEEGPVNADKGIARTSQGKEGSLATTAVDVR